MNRIKRYCDRNCDFDGDLILFIFPGQKNIANQLLTMTNEIDDESVHKFGGNPYLTLTKRGRQREFCVKNLDTVVDS